MYYQNNERFSNTSYMVGANNTVEVNLWGALKAVNSDASDFTMTINYRLAQFQSGWSCASCISLYGQFCQGPDMCSMYRGSQTKQTYCEGISYPNIYKDGLVKGGISDCYAKTNASA